tara:strand:- start:50 stop:265 length:216 start_codon:yes stop_codon:yes gene_type:complete
MTSSQLGDIVGNEPTICFSEWEHHLHEEAQARGVDTNDTEAMEELDEILQEESRDHAEALEAEAYEDSIGH